MDTHFAENIRQKYPEGLTGIFAIGGTRTTYILEANRHQPDPGKIQDFADHGAFLQTRYQKFMRDFFSLGGQNMIITASSFRGFTERGGEYAKLVAVELLRLIDDSFQQFYRDEQIDPYFVGIDTLAGAGDGPREVSQAFQDFMKSWSYAEGRRKLVWEIASIPLLTFWNWTQGLNVQEREEINTLIAGTTDMEALHRQLYEKFSQAVYGTALPMPHFYLGTNKSGDLKWRSPLPIALSGGEYMRLFYTPYPSLFTSRETMHRILNDLAFKERFFSVKTDYKDRFTNELAEAEYQRVMALSRDPETTLGLSRQIQPSTPTT